MAKVVLDAVGVTISDAIEATVVKYEFIQCKRVLASVIPVQFYGWPN